MIKLFYTGAGSFNTAQTLASKSLGGYISNTAVPNGVINSLFPPLSLMEFYNQKKITQYIGLALYFAFCTDVFATFEANISQNPSLVIIAAFLYMVLISEVFGK